MPIPESGYENWPRGESIGLMSTVVPSARNTVRFFRFFLFRRSAASRKCGMQLRRIDPSSALFCLPSYCGGDSREAIALCA